MIAEILNTALSVIVIAGAASLSIAFILSRALARAEYEEMLDDRLARYAGVNRKV